MRVRIHLSGLGNSIIPVDYHYIFSSWVYNTIKFGNEEMATELHYMKDVKPLTFSEIYARARAEGENLRILEDEGSFVFSSHRMGIVEAFVEGALTNPELRFGEEKMEISQIEVLREPEFKERMNFKTLSPIVVSVSRAEAKNTKERYLYPTDARWYVNLEKNVRKRYTKFTGREYKSSLRIGEVKRVTLKKYKIKGIYVRATKLIFGIEGSREIIRIAYQSGLGERTAQGFGCVEVAKGERGNR